MNLSNNIGGESMPHKKGKSSTYSKGHKGGEATAQQGGINPIVGATVGAAVGGIVGAAAAVALSDKETREKLKTAAGNLRDQATEKVQEMRSKAKHAADVTKREAQKHLPVKDEKGSE